MDKILVTSPSMTSYEEYIDEIKSIWDTKWLTNMGPKHNQLEFELRTYLGVEKISLFTNGHSALELGLQAMNLKGEVITTPFTFASTTHAIVRNGLTPVFCDINANDYTIDVDQIENLITDRTCAIVPVHVYGTVCDIERIDKLAIKYGLKVIYDAAHTFGVKYKGRSVVSYGDASMLSFHATKVYNTIEGGALCYNNDEYGNKLRKLRDFGIKTAEIIDGIGANAKMSEFHAAMGLCNLRHVDEEIAKRKEIVNLYRSELSGIDGVQLLPIQDNVKSNYAYIPVVFNERILGFTRNEVFEHLRLREVYARKYFYPIANSFDCYLGKYDPCTTPVALHVSKRVLTLPLYASLSLENAMRVVDGIKEML